MKTKKIKYKDYFLGLLEVLFYTVLFAYRAFDVDLLHIAQHFKIPVAETAISWQEIDGKCFLFTRYELPWVILNCVVGGGLCYVLK